MAADGSIIIATKIDTSGIKTKEWEDVLAKLADSAEEFTDAAEKATDTTEEYSDATEKAKKETEGLNDELQSTTKESEKAGDGLKGAFGEIFSASALADITVDAIQEIGEAVKELAIESIDAASDIRAENTQFAETFKELEDTATDSLNAIADDVGITASRMKQSYAKTFAFTKSVGADSEEAMDIANRAMRAAADSAAYYDKSVEEATETLQSFLKGNYENDAALGIAATETTRNAKANELYAKSFQDLSEAQKVDVLLAMVEAGNEASGALGQAAREADAWTNVTGEAEEAMRQLLAVIGDPILEALTPIIQEITKSIYDMIKVSDSKKLKKSIDNYIEAWENAEESLNATADSVEANVIMADHYIKRLEELEEAGLDTAQAHREYETIVEKLNELIPDLNLTIDENTGLLKQNKEAIYDTIDALKERALYEAKQTRYNDSLKAQAEAIIAVENAEADLVALRNEEAVLIQELEELTEKYNLTAEGTASAVRNLPQPLLEVQNALSANRTEQEALNDKIEEANVIIAEHDGILQEWERDNEELANSQQPVVDGLTDVQKATQNASETVRKLYEEYKTARETAQESINAQIGYFDDLSAESTTSAEEIIQNWRNQQAAFENYSENLRKAIDMNLDQALVEQLSDGSVQSMQILDALVNDVEIDIDEINEAFQEVQQSRDTVVNVMADVETNLSTKLDDMAKDTKDVWGAMAEEVGLAIAQMQEAVNSLTGQTVYLDVVTRKNTYIGSSGFRSSAPATYADTASTYSIPYLAKGAVIPPRAPFYAVLGDQKNGTNIEAPAEEIYKQARKAVAEVIGQIGNQDINIQFTGDLAQLGRVLKPVIERENKRKGNSIASGSTLR